VRVFILGAVRGLNENRWKDDVAEAGQKLGWHVIHVNARDYPVEDVVRQCRGADMLLWLRTHHHDPRGDAAEMLRRVEDGGTTTVGLHLDLYWGHPGREPHIGAHPWWTCQYVFTADGGPRDWASRGVNHHWCPPAMGYRFFGRLGNERRQYRHKAAFVGSCSRIHRGRAELLPWARMRYRRDFRWYGGHPGIWGQNLSDLYASTEVILGHSAPAARYWSDRVPITLGRGGLLTHPDVPGFAEMGFDDNVMVTYPPNDLQTLGRKLDGLTPSRRAELVDNALTLISERHMWTHRLERIAACV